MNPSSGMLYTNIALFLGNLFLFLSELPAYKYSVYALIHLLNIIDTARVCKGNCKEEFVQLAHEGFFIIRLVSIIDHSYTKKLLNAV